MEENGLVNRTGYADDITSADTAAHTHQERLQRCSTNLGLLLRMGQHPDAFLEFLKLNTFQPNRKIDTNTKQENNTERVLA